MKKFFLMLLSLVIAFGLWLYVMTVVSPESESTFYNIPVEFVGTSVLNERGLMIVSDTSNVRMDLTLRGNRSDLSKLSSSNITIIVDLSKITSAGEHQLTGTISFPSGTTAEVQKRSLDYVSVTVAEQTSKEIPVEVVYPDSVPSGYEADKDNIRLDHSSVKVTGPTDVVSQIACARVTVSLSGKMNDITGYYDLILYDEDDKAVVDLQYISTDRSQVYVALDVYKTKVVTLKFELDCTDSGLTADMVTLYAPSSVTLMGSYDAIYQMDDSLSFTIKLSDYTESSVITFTPALPEGVKCKEEIQVEINIPQMSSVTLTVSTYQIKNVPQGLVVLADVETVVEVWGPEETVKALTGEDILAVIDCTEVNANSVSAPVSYTVNGLEYLTVRGQEEAVSVNVIELVDPN